MRRVKYGLNIALLFFALIITASAANNTSEYSGAGVDITLYWTSPHAEMRTVDVLLVDLRVAANADTTITLPQDFGGDTQFKVVNHYERRNWNKQKKQFVVSGIWELRPFLAGDYTLPPLSVSVTDAAGNTSVITTDAQPIQVVSILPKKSTISDIHKPVTQSGITNVGPWIGLMVAGCVLVMLSLGGRHATRSSTDTVLTPTQQLLKDCELCISGYGDRPLSRDTSTLALKHLTDYLAHNDRPNTTCFDPLFSALKHASFGRDSDTTITGKQFHELLNTALEGDVS